MSRRRAIHREPRTIAAVMACVSALLIGIAFWPAMNRAHAGQRSHSGDNLDYASPLELLLSPDGARLYVLCQQSEEIRVLDAATYAAVKTIAVGHEPRGMALSSVGDRLFVTNSWDDTLSVIDTQSLVVVATWPVGAEPSGVVEDRAGKQLFVANRISERCSRARCADRRGREAADGRAGHKLPDPVARRQPHLRHAHLSQPFASPHGS